MVIDQRLVLDWTKVHDVLPIEKLLAEENGALSLAKQSLLEKNNVGSEFTGWVHYLQQEAFDIYESMKSDVDTLCQHSNALVVVGIGGSLLGAKAVYEALTHSFAHLLPSSTHKKPVLFWAGHHLAADELSELLDVLDGFTPSVVVISKSGGTTEPALAFRVLKEYMETRFGEEEASQRIYAITDHSSGSLLKMAKEKNYKTFFIPRDIGGRYSVFTPVGLFPLCVAGVAVEDLLSGAAAAYADCISEKHNSIDTNVALCYAGIRNILYKHQYKIEVFSSWSPKLKNISEWWKQLFGESDGKKGSGLFPANAQLTTDLHSLGQYIQEGERHLFLTHLKVQNEYSLSKGSIKRNIQIPHSSTKDGFEFLSGRCLSDVQKEAQQSTFLAHADGQVPTLVWELPELSAWWLGYWLYTNMFACAVGGYARGINPFDQPGVESYKENMFALLGKPGFQEKAVQIKQRLNTGRRLQSFGMSTR